MIQVTKIQMSSSTTIDRTSYYGDPIEITLAKYINDNKLTKEDIISINMTSDTCCFITHNSKK